MAKQSEQSKKASQPQAADIQVATRLRSLRQDMGLTLRELAELAGISQAYLSRVENHKAALTIAGLGRMASVLDVPMSIFFEDEASNHPITICRKGKGPLRHFRGPQTFMLQMLAPTRHGKLMEPLIVEITHEKEAESVVSHPGEEFNYVLEGQCHLIYGTEKVSLEAGDAVYYEATVPHIVHCDPGTSCRILAVVASRDYLFHGDLSKLLNVEQA